MPKQIGPMRVLASGVAAADAGDLSRERFLQAGADGAVELFVVWSVGGGTIRPVTVQHDDDTQYHDLANALTLPAGSWGPFPVQAAPKCRLGVAVTAVDAGASVTVRARTVSEH